jgi:ATP-dependent Clp protease protease subunit
MAKEILLYSPIFDFVAESLIEKFNEFDAEDVTIRINSPGGSVFAGWGIVAKTLEHTGKVKIKVDGVADSMAAIYLLFSNNVEALNVSRFTLHRASTFSTAPKDLQTVAEINKDIKAAFEKKIDIPAFEKIAGVTLDEFFTSENVIDVAINAKQAKKIGLINSIKTLEAADFQALNMKFAAIAIDDTTEEVVVEPVAVTKENPINQNNKKMTLEDLKTKHPEVYAQAFNAGNESGIKAEKDRVGSWMVFVGADAVAVTAGIKSGESLSATASAELGLKALGAAQVVASTEENPTEEVVTEEVVVEPTALSDFETALDNQLKIK